MDVLILWISSSCSQKGDVKGKKKKGKRDLQGLKSVGAMVSTAFINI